MWYIHWTILDHILWLPVNITEVFKQISERLSETEISVGGSLRIIIAILGDIFWPLIGRCWCSEPSDWPESLDTLEGIFHVSSALQLPLSTFNQVSSSWWSHFIQHYHHLSARMLRNIETYFCFEHNMSESFLACLKMLELYTICVDIKCGIILREGY